MNSCWRVAEGVWESAGFLKTSISVVLFRGTGVLAKSFFGKNTVGFLAKDTVAKFRFYSDPYFSLVRIWMSNMVR